MPFYDKTVEQLTCETTPAIVRRLANLGAVMTLSTISIHNLRESLEDFSRACKVARHAARERDAITPRRVERLAMGKPAMHSCARGFRLPRSSTPPRFAYYQGSF